MSQRRSRSTVVRLRLGEALRLDVRFACPTMTLGATRSRLGPSNGLIVAYLADPFASTFPGGCNLVSARDVARGHVLIAEHGLAGESYLLGAENLTWRELHGRSPNLPGRATAAGTDPFPGISGGHRRGGPRGDGRRLALSTREQAAMVGRYYWYSHAKAAALGYAPGTARDALVETISWLAASPHVTRETRTHMHLAADVYRFRSATTETVQ